MPTERQRKREGVRRERGVGVPAGVTTMWPELENSLVTVWGFV